jgi:hypothetical protein
VTWTPCKAPREGVESWRVLWMGGHAIVEAQSAFTAHKLAIAQGAPESMRLCSFEVSQDPYSDGVEAARKASEEY